MYNKMYKQNFNSFFQPIDIRWIRTGSQPYWKFIYSIIIYLSVKISLTTEPIKFSILGKLHIDHARGMVHSYFYFYRAL